MEKIITLIFLVVTLESCVLVGGFQVALSQKFIIPTKHDLSPSFPVAFHIAKDGGDSNMLIGKKSPYSEKVSAHYPTIQEKERIDRILNQTLSLLPPLGRAINESHSCILDAVICGSGYMTNATMVRL